jgi:GGDEF domain-containing protein
LRQGQRFTVQYRILTQDGKPKWVLERGVGVPEEQALTQVREQAQRRYREIFEQAPEGIFQTEQGIARAARRGYHLVVVFLDLDNFRFANGSLGHDAGDDLMKQMAQRLGGDEFMLPAWSIRTTPR